MKNFIIIIIHSFIDDKIRVIKLNDENHEQTHPQITMSLINYLIIIIIIIIIIMSSHIKPDRVCYLDTMENYFNFIINNTHCVHPINYRTN